MNIRVIRKKIPFAQWIGGKWINDLPMDQLINDFKKNTEQIAVKKPSRRTGASFLEDLVSGRRLFNLCDNCYRKYIKGESWWKAKNYVPLWNHRCLTYCDGCGEVVHCFKLAPEEAPPDMARINFQEGAKIYGNAGLL